MVYCILIMRECCLYCRLCDWYICRHCSGGCGRICGRVLIGRHHRVDPPPHCRVSGTTEGAGESVRGGQSRNMDRWEEHNYLQVMHLPIISCILFFHTVNKLQTVLGSRDSIEPVTLRYTRPIYVDTFSEDTHTSHAFSGEIIDIYVIIIINIDYNSQYWLVNIDYNYDTHSLS